MAQQFAGMLQTLGCPEAVPAASLDWLYDDAATSRLLTWLADNLSARNVVSTAEAETSAALKHAGRYLTGDALDQAQARRSDLRTQADEETLQQVEEDAEAVEQECTRLRARLAQLQRQNSLLGASVSTVSHRAGVTESLLVPAAKRSADAALRKLDGANARSNDQLGKLSQAVAELAAAHSPGDHHEDGSSDVVVPSLLLHVPLDEYADADDEYTRAVETYVQAAFVSGVGEHALLGRRQYELLRVTDPSLATVAGESEATHHAFMQELHRLRTIYPISQREHVLAETSVVRIRAIIAEAEKQSKRRRQYSAMDVLSLRRDIDNVTSDLHSRKERLAKMMREAMQLSAQNASVLAAPVLQRDYDLKLARQQYHLERQDMVIRMLYNQGARHAFLHEMLQSDNAEILGRVRLLTDLHTHLGQRLDAVEQRISRLHQLPALIQRSRRTTIADDDALLQCLAKLVFDHGDGAGDGCSSDSAESQEDAAVARSYSALLRATKDRVSLYDTAVAAVRDLVQGLNAFLRDQGSVAVNELHRLCFADSSTRAPSFTAPQVLRAQRALDTALARLQQRVEQVMGSKQEKVHALAQDARDSALQRSLWILFFTDVRELARVTAHLDLSEAAAAAEQASDAAVAAAATAVDSPGDADHLDHD